MTNLLTNPGFEGPYRAWNGISEISVAEGWLPFWAAQRSGGEEWRNRRPVYHAAERSVDPRRVRTGQTAQMYYTSWATHIAGLMQVVDVKPGQRLRLQAFGHAWSTNDDTPGVSTEPGDVRMKIGIDPTGGSSPFNTQVVWSAEEAAYDTYSHGFVVEATARETKITVFLLSAPQWPKKHNDVYWDDAVLELVPSGIALPEEKDAMLVMESATRKVGNAVGITVTSSRQLANVQLNVSGPGGGVYTEWQGLDTGGRGFVWRWKFVPKLKGPYTATFSADNVEAISATIHILDVSEVGQPLTTTRGKPRVQYERTYVLLPPSADKEWIQAVLDSEAWEKYRWTVGFSADDAGIGDLDDRVVIIVNPSAWSDPIEAWFQLWYPGVKTHPITVGSPAELLTVLKSI